ncbi:tetratricopeptide repeat-containing hybrid sensor histidine kinase/response regulator [Flavobacterium gilvum]|uniref:histidine kinase n=1 Tax=Flavobacterium gilvum TaxID=1492737 RepID=A0AAC9I0U6_9FLAO|nr:ATP-binding protein [Flavobacterium gilvum]AOW08049.1 hybrid sensor histidine kinase/response regulator [Flavobacterium gilvum]KFC57757.1 histidine kinase [Flavobacterium gilvum]
MKYFLLFTVFFHSLLYCQIEKKADSIAYYSISASENIKNNNYKKALSLTQKAIDFSKKNNDSENEAIQTYNLGKIYFDLNLHNDAIELLGKSIKLFNTVSNAPDNKVANAYYYLSLSYTEKKNYPLAEICIFNAEKIKKELNIDDKTDLINLQKGILAKIKGDNDLASNLFNNIISKPNSDILTYPKAEAFYQIGTIEATNKRYNLALNYFNRALELNLRTKSTIQKSNILLALSTVYDKLLDKSNAFAYLKKHLNVKESIVLANEEKLGINDYEVFKESQRKQEELLLEKENKEKEKADKFSKLISILAIAIISVLSLLSLSLYKNNIIRNQTNALLREKNNELIAAKNKAEEASKARSEFLSTVSHELRTPLNAINGITHLLLEEKPKKSQMHYLSSLKFSGNYLTTFINDILEINKIESNKLEIEYINFNIKQLLGDIQNSLKEIATINNNKFILKVDPSIPENLIGDPTKLSQIFMNLINNALKFTNNGTVIVAARLRNYQNENATIFFQIVDTGIGIPEDKLKTVFESFSQGSVEINRKFGGTGLGLTIVKKLVRILGGHIRLKSIVGEGSTFSFELNFKVDSKPMFKKVTTKNYNPEIFKNKKILVVEDNKINQMITKKMLVNKGMDCTILDNGEDAIEILKDDTFDLVLMDVHLLGINGTIATQQIREFDNITPILALTAISLNENREMLLSFGMTDVITKPFVAEDFYDTIAQNLIIS